MEKYKKMHIFGFIFIYLAIVFKTLFTVFSGDIPFWFDPARDILMAKQYGFHTLIGQNSGIPGIFYGPYWIWALRVALFVSPDPRIIDFILQIVPYIIFLPIIFYLLKNTLTLKISSTLWILFMLGTGASYATQLWNPHPTPLLLLLLILLLVNFNLKNIKNLLVVYFIGLTAGLIFSFHISLGIPVIIGTTLILATFLFMSIQKHNQSKKLLFLAALTYVLGLISTLIPQILFDIRHDFSQTKTFIHALITYGDVVQIKGLNKVEIIEHMINRFGIITHLPLIPTTVLIVGTFMILSYIYFKQQLTIREKKLFFIVMIFIISILFIYLTAKNPVWDYHFIATEILFLLLIGLLARKFRLAESVLYICTLILFIWGMSHFVTNFSIRPTNTNYAAVLNTVHSIAQDAGDGDYTVFASNPAVYTYEYTYLFSWLYHKDIPYDPNTIVNKSPIVYLIIPKTDPKSLKGYIQYRTPEDLYETINTWVGQDGTVVVKRSER